MSMFIRESQYSTKLNLRKMYVLKFNCSTSAKIQRPGIQPHFNCRFLQVQIFNSNSNLKHPEIQLSFNYSTFA